MNSDSEKVKVKLNVKGIEIELECKTSQLDEAIRSILHSVSQTHEILNTSQLNQELNEEYKAFTCKDAIEKLWEKGWFEKPRKLSEIWHELSKHGFNYDKSAISHALLDLVKEGKLTRFGKVRRYLYVQRVPYKIMVKEDRKIQD